jgi:hypothetical protein
MKEASPTSEGPRDLGGVRAGVDTKHLPCVPNRRGSMLSTLHAPSAHGSLLFDGCCNYDTSHV